MKSMIKLFLEKYKNLKISVRGNTELDLTIKIKGSEIIDKNLPSPTANTGPVGFIGEINPPFTKKKVVQQNSKRMR